MGKDIPTVHYNNTPSDTVKIKGKWWLESEDSMHSHIFGIVKKINEYQSYRSLNNLRFARLYANMEMLGLQPGQFARDANNFIGNRVTYNVIKACIDTAASKIAKNKPRPLFMTQDGNYDLQERAKLLTQYISGLFHEMGTGTGDDRTFYGIGRQCFTDSGVFGTGATKLYKTDEGPKAERTIVEEVIVDDNEGMYRQPRQMFQRKIVHRDVLLDIYQDKKDRAAIEAAPSAIIGETHNQSSADMITVLEGWHLPSGDDAHDGRRAIAIENRTLFQEPYKKQYFPFLFQRWNLRSLGFYGQGIAEELVGIQLEINKILRNMQIAQHLMAVPQVWLEIASQTVTKSINNRIGGIKYYTGKPPVFVTPNAMPGEMYQHLERLYQRAFELVGISQLSATSQKPAGLNSGVAIREYNDIESERFSLAGLRYEDYYIEAAYRAIDICRDLVKEGKDPVVKVKENGRMRAIKFSEVDIPDDKVTVRGYPSNFLPDTPAGKLAKVQELTQAGFYTQEEALDLLDYPDLNKTNRLKLAPRKDVMAVLESMLKKNEYIAPEPYMNVEYAKAMSQSYYLRGKADGMPEDKLELLRRFMDDVQALIERAQQPPEPPVGPGMGAEGLPLEPMATGQAAAPPVSELMPQS